MFPPVKGVRPTGEYRLELSFTDGITSEIDLRGRIAGRGGVFVPLQDVEFFKQVRVDPEAGTIVWPNGVDFCPDVLYRLANGEAGSGSGTSLRPAPTARQVATVEARSLANMTIVIVQWYKLDMREIAICQFKATCLAVLEDVRRTRRPVRVTRFGKPVAEVIPPSVASKESWLGCMRDLLEIRGDIVGPVRAFGRWNVR